MFSASCSILCSTKEDPTNNTRILRYYINPFPNKPLFLRVCSTSLLKSLWEKEKLHVTSNFSFSQSVFYQFGELSAIFIKLGTVVYKLFQFRRVQNSSFGKGLTLSQTTNFKLWTVMREEWILLQWLSSVLRNNIGPAGDRTSDFLFSSPQGYQLSYGAWHYIN